MSIYSVVAPSLIEGLNCKSLFEECSKNFANAFSSCVWENFGIIRALFLVFFDLYFDLFVCPFNLVVLSVSSSLNFVLEFSLVY